MKLPPKRRSLPQQLAEYLSEAIANGEWNEFLPSERSLCAQLQVSRPTLRAAIEQLRREGRLKVAHGKPTRIVRTEPIANVDSQVVGILSPVPLREAPHFVVCWVDALRENLSGSGWRVEFHVQPSCYAGRCSRALQNLTRRSAVSVWLIYLSTQAMQRWFAESDKLCVIAGSRFAKARLPFIDIDHRATCRHAAGQLLAKGHRRIALLLASDGPAGDEESESGFLEAFQQTKTRDVKAMVARHNGVVTGISRRLDELLGRAEPPTAIIVARSHFTLAALGHLARLNLRVPDDIAVISRDDDPFLEYVVPSLARYSCDPQAFARKISRSVMTVSEGRQPTPSLFMPQFIPGDSAH